MNQISFGDSEDLRLAYEALKRDKKLFAEMCMSHIVKDIPPFHSDIYKILNDMSERKKLYGAFVMFRGSAKSTISKTISVTHDICFAKESHILLLSESIRQAMLDLVSIQEEIINNEVLGQLFSLGKGQIWNQIMCEVSNGVFINSRGYKSRSRGLKWKNIRPTKISLDDFESEDNTSTEVQREDVRNWINDVIIPIGTPTSIYEFWGTIPHPLAWIASCKDLDIFKPPYGSYYERAIETNGKPTWENRFNKDWITFKRKFYEDQGKLSSFMQEYYNVPKVSTSASLNPDFIKEYDGMLHTYEDIVWVEIGNRKECAFTFSGVDPARSLSESADNTSIVSIARTANDDYVILDIVDEKMLPSAQVKMLFSLHNRYKFKRQCIETNGYQFALADWCRTKMKEGERPMFSIDEYISKTAKDAKYINGLEPIVSSGKLYYIKGCRGIEALKDEMRRYNGERTDNKDNILDALFLAIATSYRVPKCDIDTLIADRSKTSKTKQRTWLTI